MAVANAITNTPQSAVPCCFCISAISGIVVGPNKPRKTVSVPESMLSYNESYIITLSGLSSWTVEARIQWLLWQRTTCSRCDFSPSTCFFVWSSGFWSPLMLGNCFLSNFWAKFMMVLSNWFPCNIAFLWESSKVVRPVLTHCVSISFFQQP